MTLSPYAQIISHHVRGFFILLHTTYVFRAQAPHEPVVSSRAHPNLPSPIIAQIQTRAVYQFVEDNFQSLNLKRKLFAYFLSQAREAIDVIIDYFTPPQGEKSIAAPFDHYILKSHSKTHSRNISKSFSNRKGASCALKIQ